MDYSTYGVNDFLLNDLFLEWVNSPSPETERYWAVVMRNYPHQQENILQARELARQLAKAEETNVPVDDLLAVWDKIDHQTKVRKMPVDVWWKATAAAVGAVVLLVWAGSRLLTSKEASNQLTYFQNKEQKPVWYQLPDSSWVSLQPGSELTYENAGKERLTRLKGQAFFRVKKDKMHPFEVLAGQTKTTVLGTSFWVKVRPEQKQVQVDVVTGKVRVGEQANDKAAVDLLPNQQALYQAETHSLVKKLVEHPLVLEASSKQDALHFDDEPIGVIIDRMSQQYGIPILFTNRTIRNCMFTGDLSALSFYEKLHLICRTINASYTVRGAEVIIRGKGCGS